MIRVIVRVGLRGISSKRMGQVREYTIKRREFLILHCCKVCWDSGQKVRQATEVHHVRGRVGEMLLDTRYWLPICHFCHRKIHKEPAWATEMGYLA